MNFSARMDSGDPPMSSAKTDEEFAEAAQQCLYAAAAGVLVGLPDWGAP